MRNITGISLSFAKGIRLLTVTMLACFIRPALSQDAPHPTGDYETPGPVNADDFLPKSAFAGKKLFVQRTAQNNGLQNTYRIKAGAEEYEITGSEAALQFLGVKGFFAEDEEDTGQKTSASEAIKGFLGIDEAKRKLAARLGVDVYSRNEALQKELDRVASAMAGGGLALNIGTMPIGGAVGIGLTAIGIEQTVDSLINESSPDDLRKWNEQNLTKLGARPDVITQFLNHPWYSPRQETIITAALKKAGFDPNLFLETANKALTDEDGRYFQHVAQLLASYSGKVAPLQSLRVEDGVLCALDRNGVLVVPVSFDYAIWTQTVAQRADALASLVRSDQNIKGVKIWTDGKLSDRLKAELTQRSIDYQSLSLTK